MCRLSGTLFELGVPPFRIGGAAVPYHPVPPFRYGILLLSPDLFVFVL